MKQKVILKDGVHAPKRSRICAGKYIPSKATLSTLTSFTKSTLNNSESTNHFNSKLNIEEVNSEESKKGEGVMIDQGEKNKLARKVSVAVVQQKDIVDIIKYVDTFVKQLDKIIMTANSKQEEQRNQP